MVEKNETIEFCHGTNRSYIRWTQTRSVQFTCFMQEIRYPQVDRAGDLVLSWYAAATKRALETAPPRYCGEINVIPPLFPALVSSPTCPALSQRKPLVPLDNRVLRID